MNYDEETLNQLRNKIIQLKILAEEFNEECLVDEDFKAQQMAFYEILEYTQAIAKKYEDITGYSTESCKAWTEYAREETPHLMRKLI